jgi:hypothetical protein
MLTINRDGAVSPLERANVMCLLAMVKSDFNGEQLSRTIYLTTRNQLMDIEGSPTLLSWQLFCRHVVEHEEVSHEYFLSSLKCESSSEAENMC